MLAPEFPQIVTFYSYKGGVGRSMALMNVAYKLASWGRHVLMVDMDLEAPGISGFLERNEELDPPLPGAKDVLTLLGEVKRLSNSPEDPEVVAQQLPPLSNFLRSVKREKLATLQPELGSLGRLDLLGPDLKRDYENRLAGLGLAGTAQPELVTMSRILHFYCKAERFPFMPEWLKDLEDAQPTPYDYVLVDSRTGITEIGGLCVGPFADALVVVTGLNDQNVEGTRKFLKITGIHPVPKPPSDSGPESDGSASTVLGPKPTLLVASPVPNGEMAYRQRRLKELEEALGIKPARLSYHPQQALMETLFVRDYPDEYLAIEYATLTESIVTQFEGPTQDVVRHMRDLDQKKTKTAEVVQFIIRQAPRDPQIAPLLFSISPHEKKSLSQTELADVVRIFAFLAQSKAYRKMALIRLAVALHEQAKAKTGAAADRLYVLSDEKHQEAVRLQPDLAAAWCNWGAALSDQAKSKPGESADHLFSLSGEKYQEAVRLQPDLAAAWYNWGNALSDQAKTKTGEAADRLYALSGEKYHEAVRLQPDDTAAWSNWGAALSDQAKTKTGESADLLFALSGEKYQEAVRLQPDFAAAWSNWGNALSDQAKTKSGEAADRLFALSGEKHQEAVRLQPDFADAWSNWGAALSDQAKTKAGEAADHLYALAAEKYREAVRLQPDYAAAWSNWGVALDGQAKTKTGEAAERLFALSCEQYKEAVRLQPDHADAWSNWAATLLNASNIAPAPQATLLRSQARTNLHKALSINPKSAEYNLACLEAIESNVEEAIRWLAAAKASGTVKSKLQLAHEPDFDKIRSTPAFLAFIADIPDS